MRKNENVSGVKKIQNQEKITAAAIGYYLLKIVYVFLICTYIKRYVMNCEKKKIIIMSLVLYLKRKIIVNSVMKTQ